MGPLVMDWLSLLLRWGHVIAGIAWIGTSFYFIWLDASLRKGEADDPGIAGESWMVHGGGFYHVRKNLVAPERLPEELHWFKYEAYFTWLTGFLLLAVIYYWRAEAYLIDSSKADLTAPLAVLASVLSLVLGWICYDLVCRSKLGRRTGLLVLSVFILIVAAAWIYDVLFSGRAAFLHVGVLIGTIMVANVFFIIIPGQKKTVAALLAGEAPDPELGRKAKQRSLHNNYLTLPVIAMMVGNHYPFLYAEGRAPLMAAGVVIVGGLVRHFFNSRNSGKRDWSFPFLLPTAALAVLALALFSGLHLIGGKTAGPAPSFSEVEQVVARRCLSCHAENPSDEGFDEAPADLAFDRPGSIRANAARIYAQSVLSDAMPLGNSTQMTTEERNLLGKWFRAGAPAD
jgi:uncharacterized membrane protein